MGDVWNNVTVYGPASEIDRFKRLCIDPAENVFRSGQSGWNGCQCTISVPSEDESEDFPDLPGSYSEYVWNFQQFTSDSNTEYSFSFDRFTGFPIVLFERLAKRFPQLSFYCTCIESLDEFMGYGWFNGPPDGEEFREDYEVPADHWGKDFHSDESDAA